MNATASQAVTQVVDLSASQRPGGELEDAQLEALYRLVIGLTD